MEKDSIKKNDEEIDLYNCLLVIWRWRWLIIIGTIVAVITAVSASYLLRSYESQGVLMLSSKTTDTFVLLPEYKIYSAHFADARFFLEYLEKRTITYGDEIACLKKKLRTQPFLHSSIKPLYAYDEEEKKGSGVSAEKQYINAVQLSWKDPSPELARRMVSVMGLFVKDIIEQTVMEEYIISNYQGAYKEIQETKSGLSDLRFSLEQKQVKLGDLKNIVEGLPKTNQITSTEVVSVADGGFYYLPLSTQMVATQVICADIKLDINKTQRDLTRLQVNLELLTEFKKVLAEGGPDGLLKRVSGITDEFFRSKDLSKDEIIIVRDKVLSDFAGFERRFQNVMRFVSGPTLPGKPMPSKRVAAGIAFIMGFFFFVLLAFFIEFIGRSRQREKNIL